MHPHDPLPFHGTVVRLTEAQYGRRAGSPEPPGRDYAGTAIVPPLNVDTGSASSVIRESLRGVAPTWSGRLCASLGGVPIQ